MKANFVKVNPSGNTTVLILDPFPRETHERVASQVMKVTCLAAEQVGFIEHSTLPDATARLQMMGGEFCGNASRGFAAWLAERQFPGILQKGLRQFVVPFEASGHTGILTATVSSEIPRGQHYVELSMPVPKWIRQTAVKASGHPFTLVGFEGIVHAVTWNLSPSEEQFQFVKAEVYRELGEVNCLGVMFYEEKTQFLTPLVQVEGVGSLVWESSCGTGTVAVASALADRNKSSVNSMQLSQPGGILEVNVKWNGNVEEAKIAGDVTIEAEGVVQFDF